MSVLVYLGDKDYDGDVDYESIAIPWPWNFNTYTSNTSGYIANLQSVVEGEEIPIRNYHDSDTYAYNSSFANWIFNNNLGSISESGFEDPDTSELIPCQTLSLSSKGTSGIAIGGTWPSSMGTPDKYTYGDEFYIKNDDVICKVAFKFVPSTDYLDGDVDWNNRIISGNDAVFRIYKSTGSTNCRVRDIYSTNVITLDKYPCFFRHGWGLTVDGGWYGVSNPSVPNYIGVMKIIKIVKGKAADPVYKWPSTLNDHESVNYVFNLQDQSVGDTVEISGRGSDGNKIYKEFASWILRNGFGNSNNSKSNKRDQGRLVYYYLDEVGINKRIFDNVYIYLKNGEKELLTRFKLYEGSKNKYYNLMGHSYISTTKYIYDWPDEFDDPFSQLRLFNLKRMDYVGAYDVVYIRDNMEDSDGNLLRKFAQWLYDNDFGSVNTYSDGHQEFDLYDSNKGIDKKSIILHREGSKYVKVRFLIKDDAYRYYYRYTDMTYPLCTFKKNKDASQLLSVTTQAVYDSLDKIEPPEAYFLDSPNEDSGFYNSKIATVGFYSKKHREDDEYTEVDKIIEGYREGEYSKVSDVATSISTRWANYMPMSDDGFMTPYLNPFTMDEGSDVSLTEIVEPLFCDVKNFLVDSGICTMSIDGNFSDGYTTTFTWLYPNAIYRIIDDTLSTVSYIKFSNQNIKFFEKDDLDKGKHIEEYQLVDDSKSMLFTVHRYSPDDEIEIIPAAGTEILNVFFKRPTQKEYTLVYSKLNTAIKYFMPMRYSTSYQAVYDRIRSSDNNFEAMAYGGQGTNQFFSEFLLANIMASDECIVISHPMVYGSDSYPEVNITNAYSRSYIFKYDKKLKLSKIFVPNTDNKNPLPNYRYYSVPSTYNKDLKRFIFVYPMTDAGGSKITMYDNNMSLISSYNLWGGESIDDYVRTDSGSLRGVKDRSYNILHTLSNDDYIYLHNFIRSTVNNPDGYSSDDERYKIKMDFACIHTPDYMPHIYIDFSTDFRSFLNLPDYDKDARGSYTLWDIFVDITDDTYSTRFGQPYRYFACVVIDGELYIAGSLYERFHASWSSVRNYDSPNVYYLVKISYNDNDFELVNISGNLVTKKTDVIHDDGDTTTEAYYDFENSEKAERIFRFNSFNQHPNNAPEFLVNKYGAVNYYMDINNSYNDDGTYSINYQKFINLYILKKDLTEELVQFNIDDDLFINPKTSKLISKFDYDGEYFYPLTDNQLVVYRTYGQGISTSSRNNIILAFLVDLERNKVTEVMYYDETYEYYKYYDWYSKEYKNIINEMNVPYFSNSYANLFGVNAFYQYAPEVVHFKQEYTSDKHNITMSIDNLTGRSPHFIETYESDPPDYTVSE